MKLSPFSGVMASFALSLRAWISGAHKFSGSSRSATHMSPFQIPHAYNACPRNIPGATLHTRTGGWLTGLYQKSGDIQPLNQMVLPVLQMVHQIALHKVFYSPTRGLERFAESSNTPRIGPPFFVQARLQPFCRSSFFDSAYRSLSAKPCVSER